MLKPGDNTILCKVLNGTQDFGLYLRVMDNDVKESSTSNGVSQSP
jgi:hypothetical protein